MGFVYLMNIEGTHYYKIGKTKNVANLRVNQLQTAVPTELKLIETYESELYTKIETALHNYLKHKKYRVDDFDYLLGEWFILVQDDVDTFKLKCQLIEKNLLFLQNNKI